MNLKENIAYCRNFGVSLTFWKSLNTIIRKTGKNRFSWIIKEINNNKIENYICKTCKNIIELATRPNYTDDCTYYTERNNKKVKINNTIWLMWWQGEENAPEIVKRCIESVRLNAGNHDIIIITKNNYSDYINIPNYVIEKYFNSQKDKSILNAISFTTRPFSVSIRS